MTEKLATCSDCRFIRYIQPSAGQEVLLIDGNGIKTLEETEGGRLYYCSHGYWGAMARPESLWPQTAWGVPNKNHFYQHGDLCADFNMRDHQKTCDFCLGLPEYRMGYLLVCDRHKHMINYEMRSHRMAMKRIRRNSREAAYVDVPRKAATKKTVKKGCKVEARIC